MNRRYWSSKLVHSTWNNRKSENSFRGYGSRCIWSMSWARIRSWSSYSCKSILRQAWYCPGVYTNLSMRSLANPRQEFWRRVYFFGSSNGFSCTKVLKVDHHENQLSGLPSKIGGSGLLSCTMVIVEGTGGVGGVVGAAVLFNQFRTCLSSDIFCFITPIIT